jgi:hypothetical protein
MSENGKTIAFVVVGLVAIAIGILTAPSSAELDQDSLVGKNLTKFDAPDAAKKLRIVRFDQATGTPREFVVAEQNGLWTIPSKDGYPADAARQMAEAATSLMQRKILFVVSNNAGDHEEYGVIDPTTPKLEPGQKGVGTRVTMSDETNRPIVDLIIGKAVRDQEKQRYVRVAGQDVVYIIEIDPSKLSTNFEDWIEKDLLKLHTWDLQQVQIKDYSAELVPVVTQDGQFSVQPTWDPRSEMTLNYDDAKATWSAGQLRAFDPKKGPNGDYVDFKLGPDEELNEESLNALKNALGDLKIVDVDRKPEGLSGDLKAGKDFMKNREALKDLMSKGFTAAVTKEGGPRELISSNGEVTATMKDGTKYVLRVGDLTNVDRGGQDKEEKTSAKDAKAKDKDKSADKSDKSGVHRYLFVMAQFDENAVKRPELEKLPDLPPKTEAKSDKAPTTATTADKPTEGTASKAGEKPAGAQPPATTEAPAKKDEAAAKTNDASVKKDASAAKKDDAAGKKADEAAAKNKEDGAKKETGANKDEAAKNAAPPEKSLEKIIAERKRIEKENQKKLDDYQAQLKKGRENVKDLNLRFGDWYFVVDDDVFRKIRLSRDKVIKKKEKPKAAASGEAGKKNGAAPNGIPGIPTIPGASK